MTIGDDPAPQVASEPKPESPAKALPRDVVHRLRALIGDQRVRFLIVGGINTVVGLLVFIAVDVTLGRVVDRAANVTLGSIATLAVSQVISVIIAFVLHRRLVFRVRGHLWLDFVRFQGVYVVTFVTNLIVLPILVALGVPRIVAQVCIVAAMTVVSYLGHRHFSFRRKPGDADSTGEVDPRIE